MNNYGKKYLIHHMIEGGIIPKFDEDTQQNIQKLINLGAISIDTNTKFVTMTSPTVGLENLPDNQITDLISIASSVGKQFSNHGWIVRY